MKTYWDLSEKERAALSYEDVEKYSAAELMAKVVLGVEPLELEPDPTLPAPAQSAFLVIVNGYNTLDVAFRTESDAAAFLALQPRLVARKWLGNDSVSCVEPFAKAQIVVEPIRSKDEADAIMADLKRASDIKANNEKRRSEHEKATKAQQEALSDMWTDWYACREKTRELDRVVRTFKEYVETAGGDPVVAASFLAKVFTPEQIREAAEWHSVAIPEVATPTTSNGAPAMGAAAAI